MFVECCGEEEISLVSEVEDWWLESLLVCFLIVSELAKLV